MPDAISRAVDDVVELLQHADMAEILADFGKAGKEDPVVHFYEIFLAAYDPKMRGGRGVYYTPEPVVSYIVRSIDRLLRTRFDRPKGLADENTLILDPAAGTGTFLCFVIEQVRRKFAGQAGAWNDYVAKHLLSRVFGFELLMAPYAVAHLKLALQLQESGYRFDADRQLGICLDALEEAARKSEHFPAGCRRARRDSPATFRSSSFSEIRRTPASPPTAATWITRLVADYRFVDGRPLGEKKVWLKNDYVKFLRLGQWHVERTGRGVLAFVTDHSYLDSPTFRGMRQNLLESFDDLFILNLHGNAKRRERRRAGASTRTCSTLPRAWRSRSS